MRVYTHVNKKKKIKKIFTKKRLAMQRKRVFWIKTAKIVILLFYDNLEGTAVSFCWRQQNVLEGTGVGRRSTPQRG